MLQKPPNLDMSSDISVSSGRAYNSSGVELRTLDEENPGKSKNVKRFEQSRGLTTALYKNLPFHIDRLYL